MLKRWWQRYNAWRLERAMNRMARVHDRGATAASALAQALRSLAAED